VRIDYPDAAPFDGIDELAADEQPGFDIDFWAYFYLGCHWITPAITAMLTA